MNTDPISIIATENLMVLGFTRGGLGVLLCILGTIAVVGLLFLVFGFNSGRSVGC